MPDSPGQKSRVKQSAVDSPGQKSRVMRKQKSRVKVCFNLYEMCDQLPTDSVFSSVSWSLLSVY